MSLCSFFVFVFAFAWKSSLLPVSGSLDPCGTPATYTARLQRPLAVKPVSGLTDKPPRHTNLLFATPRPHASEGQDPQSSAPPTVPHSLQLLLEAPRNHACQQGTPWLKNPQRLPRPTWPHPHLPQQPGPLGADCILPFQTVLFATLSASASHTVGICTGITDAGSCEVQVLTQLIWGKA